jgi:hypothetical protein
VAHFCARVRHRHVIERLEEVIATWTQDVLISDVFNAETMSSFSRTYKVASRFAGLEEVVSIVPQEGHD